MRIEKLSRKELLDLSFDLINAFRIVRFPLETAQLVQDLFTEGEIKNLSKRLRIAKLLLNDQSQRDIARSLHCSTSTVIKVSSWLNKGGEGLKNVIGRLPSKYEYPDKLSRIPIDYQLPQVLIALTKYSLAKRQDKKLEDFWDKVEDKKLLDKQLKEMFRQDFKYSKPIKKLH